eukprot:CAMPEP_0177728306 /NCGR_PEP_ID=MMETSP0484_2-20121128/20814_1 /TAXON_ID=354590 /ORGANISM="Rhodomonas lens, Strain RHODO" /LENGTH=156 /DNA_ID=CAMNT_0019241077 /DNA_START=75 /DNA_END=545 /DNA_ORIENTATION=-
MTCVLLRFPHFVCRLQHRLRARKLALLDVEREARGSGGGEEVCLPAEEGWDLDDVHNAPSRSCLVGFVDVCDGREACVLLHRLQNSQPFVHPWSSEAAQRCSVRLVERGLEDSLERDKLLLQLGNMLGDAERMVFALEHVRTSDEEEGGSGAQFRP